MYQVMKTFVESGYSNTMIPDHTPRFAEGHASLRRAGYAIGYMLVLPKHAGVEATRVEATHGGAGGGRAERWLETS
jgi:hypothetical protein